MYCKPGVRRASVCVVHVRENARAMLRDKPHYLAMSRRCHSRLNETFSDTFLDVGRMFLAERKRLPRCVW